MKLLPYLVFPIVLLVTSCTTVRSKQLVGKTKLDLSQSHEDVLLSLIEGEWVALDGDVIPLSVIDAKEGVLLCGPPEGKDSGKLTLRKSGDHIFANFPPDENGERMWLLMRIQGEMEELIFWFPETARFRELIAKGEIKGTNDPATKKNKGGKEVENKSAGALVDDPSGEWVEKMVAGEFGVVFNWQNPVVLRKRKVIEGDAATKSKNPAPVK